MGIKKTSVIFMKNIKINLLPSRSEKPRSKGLTMVMDKGLSVAEAQNLCSSSAHLIDFVKLGFGTSVFTASLAEKVAVYQKNNIDVYLGGTLLEACYLRGQMDEYTKFADSLGIKTVEVSDGSIIIPHGEKCALINKLSGKYKVLSEVGSKIAGTHIPNDQWVEMMRRELEAGSTCVIAEAREAGNIGIFNKDGSANEELINLISDTIPLNKILWEAPQKAQQVWFVKQLGAEVNLGNIAFNETISLETIRCGLRGDTFNHFLPENLKSKTQQ